MPCDILSIRRWHGGDIGFGMRTVGAGADAERDGLAPAVRDAVDQLGRGARARPLERRAGRAGVHRRGVSQPPAWGPAAGGKDGAPFAPLLAASCRPAGRRRPQIVAPSRRFPRDDIGPQSPRCPLPRGCDRPPHALATFTRSAIRTRMPNLSSLRFMYLNIETKSASARAPGRSSRIFDLTNRNTFAYTA